MGTVICGSLQIIDAFWPTTNSVSWSGGIDTLKSLDEFVPVYKRLISVSRIISILRGTPLKRGASKRNWLLVIRISLWRQVSSNNDFLKRNFPSLSLCVGICESCVFKCVSSQWSCSWQLANCCYASTEKARTWFGFKKSVLCNLSLIFKRKMLQTFGFISTGSCSHWWWNLRPLLSQLQSTTGWFYGSYGIYLL